MPACAARKARAAGGSGRASRALTTLPVAPVHDRLVDPLPVADVYQDDRDDDG